MAGGACDSEEPACSGAARFDEVLVGVAIAIDFVLAGVSPVEPTTTPGIDEFAIRLIATTCERDCILCCCSAGIVAPTDGGAVVAVVVVEDNEEEDVAVFSLVLTEALVFGTIFAVSTIGGRGGFGT